MCYASLKEIADGSSGNDSKGKQNLRKSATFMQLLKVFEKQMARGLSMHPKMDTLRTLLIQHFGQEMLNAAEQPVTILGKPKQSRAMVFVSFRECVEEIVELLNKENPMIRAKPFIGQSTDKQSKKGYTQKQQLEVRLSTLPLMTAH